MNYEWVKLLGEDGDREKTEEESAPEGTSPKAKKVCPGCGLYTIIPPIPELEVQEEEEERAFSSA